MKTWLILLQTFILLIAAEAQVQLAVPVDRPMAAAGKFYPADPEELRVTLKSLFDAAEKPVVTNVQALISPHAGYMFSGRVAASSFNQIDPDHQYENIFIIGSSHSKDFDGASVYNAGDYLTPLGKVPVNRELAAKLIGGNPVFSFVPDADENEHSIEVQVPFLQYHMRSSLKLVPIIIGTDSEETCKNIAKALLPYFNEKNLFIISTDFSHYPAATDAKSTDRVVAEAIMSNSPANFIDAIRSEKLKTVPDLATPACGWTSILTLLYLTSPEPGIVYQPVIYRNSGDVPGGNKSNVVGYWSIAVARSTSESGWLQPGEHDKRILLELARNSIEQYLKSGVRSASAAMPSEELLQKNYGVFVTLWKKDQLRGCIGKIKSQEPLYMTIPEIAISAAEEDPRFLPVSSGELDSLEIEISILSPMKKVKSVSEVIPGKHGVLIRKNGNEGTLLPHVARQYHWTREELLGYCSMEKAGLGWNGWKTADIYVYEAAEFREKDLSGSKE